MFLWGRKWLKKVDSRDQDLLYGTSMQNFLFSLKSASGRGFVESELEGELKVHGGGGDDFSSEFRDL